jgi:hypothetical protein
MNYSRSGDRHLRFDPEGRLRGVRRGHKVVVVHTDSRYASTPSGQHLLQMLVNLLARQYNVIDRIELDVPGISVHPGVFLLHATGGTLLDELLSLGSNVAGTEMAIVAAESASRQTGDSDIVAHVLVGPLNPKVNSTFAVATVGDGWGFWCSTERKLASVSSANSSPLGPFIAACFAAAAVFCFLRDLEPRIDLGGSLWDFGWGGSEYPPTTQGVGAFELPPLYVIGCGAVGAALAFTLAASPKLCGDIILIDPQNSDETNRNRLLSARYIDIGVPKVNLAARVLAASGLSPHIYMGQWPDYTIDSSRKVPAHVRKEEARDRYEWIMSCVDRNVHRRNIGGQLPKHIVGASTSGMAAQVAYYSMVGACQCIGCDHPVPALLPTEELRDQLKRMAAAERVAWYGKHDADERLMAAIEEYLADPDCGTVGAAALARLGMDGETDWAVGFVSVAAGVMQAAVLLQLVARGVQSVIAAGSECRAWFLSSQIGRSFAGRKASCDLCGDPDRQNRFAALWMTGAS